MRGQTDQIGASLACDRGNARHHLKHVIFGAPVIALMPCANGESAAETEFNASNWQVAPQRYRPNLDRHNGSKRQFDPLRAAAAVLQHRRCPNALMRWACIYVFWHADEQCFGGLGRARYVRRWAQPPRRTAAASMFYGFDVSNHRHFYSKGTVGAQSAGYRPAARGSA